jgi:hypothetical protein
MTDTVILSYANFIAALGTIGSALSLWLKMDDDNKRQNRQLSRVMRELRVNTECNKAALETLIANGANGACHDALGKLNAFLNDAAHSDD